MGIDRSDIIDALGISKADGKVVLSIADHLPWDEAKSHFCRIERKVGAYLAFIASGQLIEELPVAQGKAFRIELIHQHAPSAAAQKFLSEVQTQLRFTGIEFIAMSLPDGH